MANQSPPNQAAPFDWLGHQLAGIGKTVANIPSTLEQSGQQIAHTISEADRGVGQAAKDIPSEITHPSQFTTDMQNLLGFGKPQSITPESVVGDVGKGIGDMAQALGIGGSPPPPKPKAKASAPPIPDFNLQGWLNNQLAPVNAQLQQTISDYQKTPMVQSWMPASIRGAVANFQSLTGKALNGLVPAMKESQAVSVQADVANSILNLLPTAVIYHAISGNLPNVQNAGLQGLWNYFEKLNLTGNAVISAQQLRQQAEQGQAGQSDQNNILNFIAGLQPPTGTTTPPAPTSPGG